MSKRKMIFSVNGFVISTGYDSNLNKIVYLHDSIGSLLAQSPLKVGADEYKGIDFCITELRRFLKPATKLTFTKDNKDIEICLHWSREYNQYRITFNKPDSKYKPSTAYEDTLTDTQSTVAYIVNKAIASNVEYVLKVVDKLKVNVATRRMENNW